MISEIMHSPFTLGFFFLFFMAANILENYWREQEKFYPMSDYAARCGMLWHDIQFIGWAVVFGYVVFLIYGVNWEALRVIILFSSVWWILYDGSLNLLNNRNFLFQSRLTTSSFEKYGTPAAKFVFLLCAVLLFFII